MGVRVCAWPDYGLSFLRSVDNKRKSSQVRSIRELSGDKLSEMRWRIVGILVHLCQCLGSLALPALTWLVHRAGAGLAGEVISSAIVARPSLRFRWLSVR